MFIEINGRILDCEVYEEEIRLLYRVIRDECAEIFKKHGFNEAEGVFCNEDLGICCFVGLIEQEHKII